MQTLQSQLGSMGSSELSFKIAGSVGRRVHREPEWSMVLAAEQALRNSWYPSSNFHAFRPYGGSKAKARDISVMYQIPYQITLRRSGPNDGIVSVGTFVKPGDILVGKVISNNVSEHLPESKLLRAIFGAKSKN